MREIDRYRVCVCMCVWKREMESVCVCVGKIDSWSVFVCEREIHRVCVCSKLRVDFRKRARFQLFLSTFSVFFIFVFNFD